MRPGRLSGFLEIEITGFLVWGAGFTVPGYKKYECPVKIIK